MALTSEQYVAAEGMKCPKCESNYTFERGEVVPNGKTLTVEWTCKNCNTTWTEDYGLVGFHFQEN